MIRWYKTFNFYIRTHFSILRECIIDLQGPTIFCPVRSKDFFPRPELGPKKNKFLKISGWFFFMKVRIRTGRDF